MGARRKLLRGMVATRTPVARCECGQALDRASHPTARPREGDVSICIGCGALRRFNADLTLRAAGLAELGESEQADARAVLARLGFASD